MNAIEFGKFLASLRNEKGLTQEELAEKLYIDKRKVSRWECGMSIPDFETIVKLSEILDVTPYEFSICKRIENEKLSKMAINKFKNIKDFKKYKLKKKILLIISLLLGIFFILTTIYTFMYYGKVEIYEFRSLDDDYSINGIYINTNHFSLYNINKVHFKSETTNTIKTLSKCECEIYYNDIRIIELQKEKNTNNDVDDLKFFYHGKLSINDYINKPLLLKVSCPKDYPTKNSLIKFKFVKKYDNKLF